MTQTPTIVDLPITAVAPVVEADTDAIDRVDKTLDQIEQLSLELDDNYVMPQLEYQVPPGFKLSVVIPVYNEEATLHTIFARVNALPLPTEIILVDDFSTDRTRELLAQLEDKSNVRVIYKPQNEGKGAALRTGFEQATGEIVIVQDADLEYDPRDIPPLLKPILDGNADVVYGSRFLGEEPQDPSLVHRFGNGLLTQSSNFFTRLRLTDMETCYKAFRRNVLRSFEIKQNRFGVEPEMTAKIARRGFRIEEVPISYNARSYEEGKKIGIKDLINAFYCIVRYGLAD